MPNKFEKTSERLKIGSKVIPIYTKDKGARKYVKVNGEFQTVSKISREYMGDLKKTSNKIKAQIKTIHVSETLKNVLTKIDKTKYKKLIIDLTQKNMERGWCPVMSVIIDDIVKTCIKQHQTISSAEKKEFSTFFKLALQSGKMQVGGGWIADFGLGCLFVFLIVCELIFLTQLGSNNVYGRPVVVQQNNYYF